MNVFPDIALALSAASCTLERLQANVNRNGIKMKYPATMESNLIPFRSTAVTSFQVLELSICFLNEKMKTILNKER